MGVGEVLVLSGRAHPPLQAAEDPGGPSIQGYRRASPPLDPGGGRRFRGGDSVSRGAAGEIVQKVCAILHAALPHLPDLPSVPRRPAAGGGLLREARRKNGTRGECDDAGRGARVHRFARAGGARVGDRRGHPSRAEVEAEVHARCRSPLRDSRPFDENPLRRGIAADQPRELARGESGRRALRAGRTERGSSSARHGEPGRRAQGTSRPRQHGGDRRTRSRHHPRGGLSRRPRTGRGPFRRGRALPGGALGRGSPEIQDDSLPLEGTSPPRSRAATGLARRARHARGGVGAQP